MKRKKTPETRVTTKPEEITPAVDETEEVAPIDAAGTAAHDVQALATGGRKRGEPLTVKEEQDDFDDGRSSAAPHTRAEIDEWGQGEPASAENADPSADVQAPIEAPEPERVDYSALEYEGLRRTETFEEEAKPAEKPGGRRGASSRRKKGTGSSKKKIA